MIPEKAQPRTGMFENGIFRVLRSTEQRVTATFFEDLVRGRRFLFLAFCPAEIKKLKIEIGCLVKNKTQKILGRRQTAY